MLTAIACLSSASLLAVPNGYSINSDSPSAEADSLYIIDPAGQVAAEVDRELRRLEGMGQSAPEAHVIRKYLEWIAEMPWETRAANKDDLNEVERVLEEDHEGLEEVKKRILEHMAVLKLNGEAL